MDFYELAKKRVSIRDFNGKRVNCEDLDKILEAGRIAPTAMNLQPQMIYVIEEDAVDTLKEVCDMTYGARTFILVCSDKNVAWKSKVEEGYSSYEVDGAIVATHMILEATSLGVDSVFVRNFNSKEVQDAFYIPKHIVPVGLLVLGYRSEEGHPNKWHSDKKDIMEEVVYL